MVSRSIKPETSGLSVVAFCYRVGTAFQAPLPYENLQSEAERSQNVL